MTPITLIISGGQTGADQGGLRAAKRRVIATGGYAPKNFWTEDGESPWLATEFGLLEGSGDYLERTKRNVRLGDATIIFGKRSPGSNRTEEFCRLAKKPCKWIGNGPLIVPQLRIWIVQQGISTLNVAGNRESVTPGIGAAVEAFLLKVLA